VPRLFVGIDFPTEVKLSLAKPCAGVPGAKWVEPSKFHLTLRFIGTVEEPMAAEITAALRRVAAPRFGLTLAGVGHFGRHTLWVGVEENPALMCLQGKIENELQRVGLTAEARPYLPHVKLAHLRRCRRLHVFLTKNAEFRIDPFEVRSFSLIESHPSASGAIYGHKADYALR